ncbi:hypothetical protein [uncultured Porticoccus sp.]|uniref:hypothetical protein n=1 Tax=uncultured Porticoccus sp. TaxID=1256050 RepID=UPI0026097644|nr:hypothetical protein [uncultured Porticoccus sp.]
MDQQPHSSGTAGVEQSTESEIHDPTASLDSISDLIDVVCRLARDSADQIEAIAKLGLMELQLSVASLKKMAGLWVIFCFGLLSTWSLAIATIIFAGIWTGLSVPVALLLCLILNAGITLWLFKTLRKIGKDVGFSRLSNFLEDAGSEDETSGR